MININTLLENIFNSSNQINYQNNEIVSLSNKFDDIKNETINWVNFFHNKKNGEVLLPFINGNEYYWYSCTNEKTNAKRINDELNSFVSAYANISSINEDIKPHEEKLISIFGNNNVLKITPNENFKKEFLNSVSQYRKLLEKKPKRNKTIVREFSVIRSDFEKALFVNNKFEAERNLEEMKRTGRLDKINQIFLEIYMNSKLGQIDKILDHPYFTDIIKCKMPKQILSSILEAIYLKYFYSYELNSDFTSILKVFKEDVLYPYKDLLKTRKDIKNSSVIKIFFIKELINDEINYLYCQELINEYPINDQSGKSFLNQLLKSITIKQDYSINNHQERYKKALSEIENTNYDSALNILLSLPPNIDIIKSILDLVRDINSNESYNSSWNYIKNVNESIINELTPRTISKYNELKELISVNRSNIPDNIHLIIKYFLEIKDEFKTRELIENTYKSWQINFYLKDKKNMFELISLLNELNQNKMYISLYKGCLLSKILDTFFIELDINEQLKNLSNSILSGYIFFENFTNPDLIVFQELCNYSIISGLDNQQFEDIIDTINDIFKKNSSIQNINWFLDTTELITLYSPNNNIKSKIESFFIGSLYPYISQNIHRIESWSTIEQLGKDFNVYDSLIKNIIPKDQDAIEEKTSEILRGKLVSIYTLTDQVAYRAKSKIEKLYPGVTVKINNDKCSNPVLVNLARTSDIFIFCWKSSKHQAFFTIKENLRDKNSFIQPEGKGSDSIIRRLNQYIESNF